MNIHSHRTQPQGVAVGVRDISLDRPEAEVKGRGVVWHWRTTVVWVRQSTCDDVRERPATNRDRW